MEEMEMEEEDRDAYKQQNEVEKEVKGVKDDL